MTGKQEAEATITLHEAGFEVSVDQVENDIPEGEVIEQDPSAESEAEKGSTVAITVSLGPGTVKVPKVNGLSVADAKRALEDKGFETEVETRTSSSVPDGKVIGSESVAGLEDRARVDGGADRLDRRQDRGGPERARPRSGLGDHAAPQAGFVVNANPTDSDEPEDQVLEQDPPAGEEVKIGTEVTITYSSGVGTLTLTDYVGQKLTYAQRKLARRGPLGLGGQTGRQQLLPGRHRALPGAAGGDQAQPRRSGDADRGRLHRAPRHDDRQH